MATGYGAGWHAHLDQLEGHLERRRARLGRALRGAAAAVRGDRCVAYGRRTAPARPGEEAGLDEQAHRLRLDDRLAVEALDREPLRAARAHVRDERLDRRPEPLGIRVAQRDERAAAALDEQRRLAVEQDDPGARDPSSPRTGPPRPRHRGAVRLRGIGRGEHERVAEPRSSRRSARSSRSRSTAPGSANCAPPSPSTK